MFTEDVMNELRNILGERLIVTPKIRYDHGKDASYHPPVLPDAVAFPLSTEEVSSILKICNKYKFPGNFNEPLHDIMTHITK
jgi:D-lactate dehydrogenase (cytochrome)